jgi:hypothetical protein
LTPEQIAELWQEACSECRFFTVGPVATAAGPVLQVRCPQGGCQSSILPTKELLLDQAMVDAVRTLGSRFPDRDVSTLFAALTQPQGALPPVGPIVQRTAVRLAPTVYFRFYSWSDHRFAAAAKSHLIALQQHG